MRNERKKNKIKWNTLLYCFCRIAACSLFIFLNHCEAQTIKAIALPGTKNPKLAGIYSSKASAHNLNLQASATNPNSLNKGEGGVLPADFPVGNKNYKEQIDKRTSSSRTFTDGHGNVIIQYGSKNLNYPDSENKFQIINAKLQTSPPHSLSLKEGEGEVGWTATHQQFPIYLYKDGSTAITSDTKNKIIFNRNCKINNTEIKYSDYTVGEDGMLISNVFSGVDKKIIFYENRIETDYIIRKPFNTNTNDLIISEEIELPASPPTPLHMERGEGGDVVVYSSDNKEQARFKTPVFYDANKVVELGEYNLIHLTQTSPPSVAIGLPKAKPAPLQLERGVRERSTKYLLQIIIPANWLNDASRAYPVTIDPVVTGPTSNYPPVFMNSCVLPAYASDSMLVTIPGGITIVKFIVEDSYFADALTSPPALMEYGHMKLSTACGAVTFSCQGTAADSSGTCYLVPNQDLHSDLSCCFSPSCSPQTFYLTHALARNNYGPGCNKNYIYYSPYGNWPFSAFIIGRTVETTQAEWSVSPTSVCADSCTIHLDVTTNYGVPPYTITHPWATGSAQYGSYTVGSCTSTGTQTIALTIPNCPAAPCGTIVTLSVPPPVIIDVCGDSVLGLNAKSITIKPVPAVTPSVAGICSGKPLNMPVTSCITGTTFHWAGNNGKSGTGDISDTILNTGVNPIVVTYSVVPTANGCVGPMIKDSAAVNPLPVINAGANDTIIAGTSAQLNATGGLTYLWTPSYGLNCSNCPNPSAAPAINTVYAVTGTDEHGCSANDTVTVFVTQGTEVLYIPNSFSPNDNLLNDKFFVYGTSIKNIDIKIFDRWGEQVFHSTDVMEGWDGKMRGTNVEGGVYVFLVNCQWLSGANTTRRGIVTVLR